MRKKFLALLVAAVTAGFVSPAAAKVVLFKGVLGVQAATSACSALPYSFGMGQTQSRLYRTTYRPAGVGDNGPSTGLILMPMSVTLNDLFVSSFTLPNASLNGIYRQVGVSETRSNGRLSLTFMPYTARMRVTRQEPANIVGANFLTLTLQVQKFGNVANCNVTLRGVVEFQDWYF